jgi:hypothetical protein
VHPFDFRLVVSEFARTLQGYQERAGEGFDFGPVQAALEELRARLEIFYRRVDELQHRPVRDPEAQRSSALIRRLARILVPLNFTREGRFRHDPAVPIHPLPDLAPALDLARFPSQSHEARTIQTSLLRGMNRIVGGLRLANAVIAGEE